MGGYDYDKTRGNIRAGDMDDAEQKAMFEKFKSSGGKVIKEYDDRPKGDGSAKGGRGGAARRVGGAGAGVRENRLPSEQARDKARAEADAKARARALQRAREAAVSGFWSRVNIQVKALLAGVSAFGSRKAKAKFMNLIAERGRRALMECNILGSDLFHSDPGVARKIGADLDEESYLYTELLERGHKLYRGDIVEAILADYQKDPMADVPFDRIRDPLAELYCELYYLYPYYNSYLKAADLAIESQARHGKVSTGLKNEKRRKIHRDIDFLYGVLFPKLYIALCKADMKLYPEMSAMLEQAVGVDPDKKIQNNTDYLKSQREERTDQEEERKEHSAEEEAGEDGGDDGEEKSGESENKKEAEADLPKEIRYGISLMKMYKLNQLRKKHDPSGEYDDLPYTDKVLLTSLYLSEFEFEYSFVLTTNKIKLNVDYSGGTKIDHPQRLRDLYDQLRAADQHMKLYNDAVKELKELKANPSSNYIQQSKNIASVESKRGQAGRNLRSSVKDSMQKIGQQLLVLINDMKGSHKIVGNMEEQVRFDARVEGRKRLNGKKVSQCIMEAYCYAVALAGRLDDGDLYGGVIEMNEDEFVKSFGPEQLALVEGSVAPAVAAAAAGAAGAGAAGAAEVEFDVPESASVAVEADGENQGASSTESSVDDSDEIHELDEDIDLSGGLEDDL